MLYIVASPFFQPRIHPAISANVHLSGRGVIVSGYLLPGIPCPLSMIPSSSAGWAPTTCSILYSYCVHSNIQRIPPHFMWVCSTLQAECNIESTVPTAENRSKNKTETVCHKTLLQFILVGATLACLLLCMRVGQNIYSWRLQYSRQHFYLQ